MRFTTVSGQWQGNLYDQVSAPQFRWGADVLDRLGEILGNGPVTVLDAGCGSGRVTELLLQRDSEVRVIAGDSSPSMLEAARERLAGFRDRILFVPLDLECGDLAYEVGGFGPFDAVVSTGTFHWVRNQRRMYRALHDLLVPGGLLIAQCGGAGSVVEVRDVLEHLGHDWRSFNHYAGAEETACWLREAGFGDVWTWLADEPAVFEDRVEVAHYLLGGVLAPYLSHLIEPEREAVSQAVANRLDDTVVHFVRLNVLARRP